MINEIAPLDIKKTSSSNNIQEPKPEIFMFVSYRPTIERVILSNSLNKVKSFDLEPPSVAGVRNYFVGSEIRPYRDYLVPEDTDTENMNMKAAVEKVPHIQLVNTKTTYDNKIIQTSKLHISYKISIENSKKTVENSKKFEIEKYDINLAKEFNESQLKILTPKLKDMELIFQQIIDSNYEEPSIENRKCLFVRTPDLKKNQEIVRMYFGEKKNQTVFESPKYSFNKSSPEIILRLVLSKSGVSFMIQEVKENNRIIDVSALLMISRKQSERAMDTDFDQVIFDAERLLQFGKAIKRQKTEIDKKISSGEIDFMPKKVPSIFDSKEKMEVAREKSFSDKVYEKSMENINDITYFKYTSHSTSKVLPNKEIEGLYAMNKTYVNKFEIKYNYNLNISPAHGVNSLFIEYQNENMIYMKRFSSEKSHDGTDNLDDPLTGSHYLLKYKGKKGFSIVDFYTLDDKGRYALAKAYALGGSKASDLTMQEWIDEETVSQKKIDEKTVMQKEMGEEKVIDEGHKNLQDESEYLTMEYIKDFINKWQPEIALHELLGGYTSDGQDGFKEV